jgi:hypothetical protein
MIRRILAVILAASCLLSGPLAPAGEVDREPASRQGKAFREEKNGWTFVHLEGSPEEIGYQHGSLLAAEIADLIRVCKPFLEKTTKRDWNFYRQAAEKILWPKTEPEYQREIDGIVAGLKAQGHSLGRWDLLALNALEELPYYYVPWLDKKEGKIPTTHAPGNCSAFIATGSATRDGRIVMGHNAWTNYVVGARWNIIFDIKPQYGFRILMDGLPGIITSDDDFGINEVGLMVTETTITQFEGWDPEGKPEFARARKALQYSRSIDEYTRIMLDGNNGGYANDWLLGDAKTGEIALFELGLKNSSVRRTRDGCFVGSNFPVDPKLTAEETKFDVNKKESSPNARRLRWEQIVAKNRGAIDVELGKEFETDDFDVIDGMHGANDRTLCGRVEVTSRGVPEWDWGPYFPGGTVQSKVTDSKMAQSLELWAQLGHHGSDFLAEPFLKEHPEYDWMRGLLKDMKYEPWTRFKASTGETAPRR